MTYLISSREGRLCRDGKRIPIPNKQVIDPSIFSEGDLTIDVTEENINACCQSALDLFIIPQGLTLPKGELQGTKTLDVNKDYQLPWLTDSLLVKPFRQFFRSRRNLTRGWCLTISMALHRFFHTEFNLYRCPCSYNPNDKHWWMKNSNGDVIDMTEEQYRIKKIYEPRLNEELMDPLRQSYSVKARNVAIKIAEDISGKKIDDKLVPLYKYNQSKDKWKYYKD